MKTLRLNYQEAHWLHNALTRERLDITDAATLLDHWEAGEATYDERRPIVVSRREIAALRLYLARINRPELTQALEDQAAKLFPMSPA